MFNLIVQENLDVLKKKYVNDKDMFEKVCALSLLLKMNLIPAGLVVLYNNDIDIIENNIKLLL